MFIENLPFEKSLTIPNKIAIFDLDRDLRLTYRDLFEKTATFANFLFRQKKINHGECVCSFSSDWLFNAILFFACTSLGAVFLYFPSKIDLSKYKVFPKIIFEKENFSFIDSLPQKFDNFSEIEVFESDPVFLLFDENLNLFRFFSYSSILSDSLASIFAKNINFNSVALSCLDFDSLESLTSCFIPVLIAGGTVVFSKTKKDLSSLNLDFISAHVSFFDDIKLKSFPFCELFFKSKDELRVIEMLNKKIKNIVPMFSSCGFGIYSFFRDNKNVFESDDFLLGKAGYNMKIRIVDKDNIVKDCEEGVFAMRGKNIFSGFWNDPFMTSSYLQKGWTIFDLHGINKDGIFYVKM
jgi:hypothetical protein